MTSLQFSGNYLEGTIPSGIYSLPKLSLVDFSSNQLTGIFAHLKNFFRFFEFLIISPILRFFYLLGTLESSISNLKYIASLFLNSNSLSGTIPTGLGYLNNLTALKLNDNKFSGTLPVGFRGLSVLQMLDLSENNFIGTFPLGIFSLKHLIYLDVSNNKFNGTLINNTVGVASRNIIFLNFGENAFTGSLPEVFFNTQKSLNFFRAGPNCFQGSVRK